MSEQEILLRLLEKVEAIEAQQQENTLILRSLREHSEVNTAEHDAMKIDMAHMMGDIVGLKENVADLKQSIAQVEKATAYNWGQIADLKIAK